MEWPRLLQHAGSIKPVRLANAARSRAPASRVFWMLDGAWSEACGRARAIMPALGLVPAHRTFQKELLTGERVQAFPDDIYVNPCMGCSSAPVLPVAHDLQVSWLLLLRCASPRVHCCVRLVPPALTAVFAAARD